MMTEATRLLESRLKVSNYPETEQALSKTTPLTLIELLDSKSIKVGDCAAMMIKGDERYRLLISSILEGRITTKLGKIRADNMLFRTGRHYPDALKAYLWFLADPNDEIAYNALLALVFWGDKKVIPVIKERMKRVKSPEDKKDFIRACEALEKSDPQSFNPHFTDVDGIWE